MNIPRPLNTVGGIAVGVFIQTSKTKATLFISSWFSKESDLTAKLSLLFYYDCVLSLLNSGELKNTSKQCTVLILGFCVRVS